MHMLTRARCHGFRRWLGHQAASELAQLAAELTPSAQQLQGAQEMKQQLEPVVQKLGGSLQCYGSCSNGTFMQGSDLDLSFMVDEAQIKSTFHPAPVPKVVPKPPTCRNGQPQAVARPSAPPRVVPPPPALSPVSPPPPPATPPERNVSKVNMGDLHYKVLRLFRVESRRVKHAGAKKVHLVHARIPVLKFHGPQNEVLCDVSVNNTEGVLNSLLVRRFCETEPMLAPAVRLLKHWARCRLLGDRARNGFSTYTLILMAVHVLQQQGTALNQQMVRRLSHEIAGSTGGTLDIWCQPFANSLRVPQIFARFFELYSQPAFQAGVKISIDTDEDQVPNDGGILEVICPLTQVDVQRCRKADWTLMFEEISRAAQLLREVSDVQLLFESPQKVEKSKRPKEPPPPPPLENSLNGYLAVGSTAPQEPEALV